MMESREALVECMERGGVQIRCIAGLVPVHVSKSNATSSRLCITSQLDNNAVVVGRSLGNPGDAIGHPYRIQKQYLDIV